MLVQRYNHEDDTIIYMVNNLYNKDVNDLLIQYANQYK